VLAPDIAARIAAGEVVERPASVVKELVENSLDAGASRIAVEVTGGGLSLIRVADDGSGIAADELATAFERHATSKLSDDADLMRVQTLGFRGEALPSIASVADVEIASRPPRCEAATWLKLVAGAVIEQGSRAGPGGTAVSVQNLFARLPARRSFLRSPGSETSAIAAVVTHYALAFPEVRFSLSVDGRQSFSTPGSGDMRDAAAAVYGLDIGAVLLPVAATDGLVRVEGLAGPPALSRANRSYISLFVNRRWIQNRRLTFSVEEAYQGLLMVGRHPLTVLTIAVPPEEVDVNVHPTKAEVRFRDEGVVFRAVQRAVREAVIGRSPVATATAVESDLSLSAPSWTPPLWERGIRTEEVRHAGANGAGAVNGSDFAQRTASPAPTPSQALPVLRVIGQFGNIYIIAEGPEGMYLIDQHAAHERVLYERFCAARAGSTADVQALLNPVTLELPPRLRSLIATEAEGLVAHGFLLDSFGEASFILRGVPAPLAKGDVRENVARFLDAMSEESEGDRRDRVAMSLACHGAIRAGKQLSTEEMRELVRQLEEADSPNTCPHGRPTIVHMSADALARGFGRR
jgi:DNA mismatch repair protein MutL